MNLCLLNVTKIDDGKHNNRIQILFFVFLICRSMTMESSYFR